jgi:malonyl CoA-acyl carrier protein transacylase
MTQVVVFPGQGSQSAGMGKGLWNKYPKYVDIANEILGYDLPDLCLNGSEVQLNKTQNAQAAIYVVNVLNYLDWRENNGPPDIVLGHSIGQYSAMFAAEMISYSEGLELVKYRGEFMGRYQDGAMAAVMRIPAWELKVKLRNIDVGEQIDIANYNSEYQTVIAGPSEAVDEVIREFEQDDIYAVRLKTSGAFHSRYMAEARSEFQAKLMNYVFRSPVTRLFCNVTAADIKSPQQTLANHLVSPVNWMQAIYNILDIDEEADFVECGSGRTLTNILRYNRKEHTPFLRTV